MMMVTRAPAEGAGAGVVKAGAGVVPPGERGGFGGRIKRERLSDN